jgi:hypothetical protein
MRGFRFLAVLCALWIAGCTLPTGDNLVVSRGGDSIYVIDYNLQTYVPIPDTGKQPVTTVSHRGDLEATVVWKDQQGVDIPQPFDVFQPNTVYQAEITLTAKEGYRFGPSNPFEYLPGKVSFQNDDLGDPVRRIRVSYNNSDDAAITYITDYNLYSYIPIPLAGERPVWSMVNREDVEVTVEWGIEQGAGQFTPISEATSYTFDAGAVYQASIQVRAKPGYRFMDTKDFVYPVGAVTTQPGGDRDASERDLSPVVYHPVRIPAVIDDFNLAPYIPKPVRDRAAKTSLGGAQYTGTIGWIDRETQTVLIGPFQEGREYTAEVNLTPAMGYAFTGLGQDVFIHLGAQTVSNPAGIGVVRIDFAATGSVGITMISDTDLTGRISKPAYGVTPDKFFVGGQYTVEVEWRHTETQARLRGSFQPDTPYTAVVILSADPGYTLTGIGENAFTHRDAGTVTNSAGSGMVMITFPPDPFLSYQADSFGPAGAAGSALKLMMDKSGDDRAVTIDLPAGTETIIPSSVDLREELTSPGNVTINGNGRVLRIEDTGTLLTVGKGVTLTLRNITLKGISNNTSPLVVVQFRGRLILEGVILEDNSSINVCGGVWVNGGELVMREGTVIKKMTFVANNSSVYDAAAGGMVNDNNGRVTIYGGILGVDNTEGHTSTIS